MKVQGNVILLCALLIWGCEAVDGESLPVVSDDVAAETKASDSSDDVEEPSDAFAAEALEPEVVLIEPDTSQPCQAGEGCFEESCSTGSDCLSGICTMHLGQKVCSKTCDASCPTGWDCNLVGQGSDGQYACVSRYSHLCLPCEDENACSAEAPTACVNYGDGTSFCGGACSLDSPCPDGHACQEVETLSGVTSFQCVNSMGVCPCSKLAIDSALSTPCEIGNDIGTCFGLRVCEPTGLSACSATLPQVEACNGIDDDCNGMTDEDVCDDGNPCTQDTCSPSEGCLHSPLDSGECLDGDACTQADHCEAGLCVGEPLICNDGNECTDESCDPENGCQYAPNFNDCDDGDPCTLGDSCKNEACAPGPLLACDDGNPCTDDACGDGGCVSTPNQEACDDGNPCTSASTCSAGACLGTEASDCDDGNPCTTDGCLPSEGCISVDNSLPCDDENVCTLGDVCALGACSPGAALLTCDDGNPCTTDTCDPIEGCVFTPNGDNCDDGNACTASSSCVAGACTGLADIDCDDGNDCTTDGCVTDTGCVAVYNTLPCDDGDLCTQGDACLTGACAGGVTLLVCDDGNPCTADTCDPDQGCQFDAMDTPCDDANACTTDDACIAGLCLGLGSLACDDGNPCTADSCLPDGGCAHADLDGPCNDGDTCTANDVCVGGVCQSGPPLTCDDGNPCTDDLCTPSGCLFSHNAEPCDDADPCTTSSVCALGSCAGVEYLVCDDANPCTTDGCDPVAGCVNTPTPGPCTDGDPCTLGDGCVEGACAPGAGLECDDSNPCTEDGCVNGTCAFTPNSDDCDDGNPCTETSLCLEGLCQGQDALDCDDGNPCTDDSCHPLDGCTSGANSAPCTDGNACTQGDTCVDTLCMSGADLGCDDGDDCTTDSCDVADGCHHLALSPCCGDGVTEGSEECDDGNEVDGDDCANDCTAPPAEDWRIGTWAGTPVYGVKVCASGDYFCQAREACEQATGSPCTWQAYTCTTYNDQNGSFYPTSNPMGRSVSTSGSSSLNWTVTSACSAQFSNSVCIHGAGDVYGNLCCCACGGIHTGWNEGNQNCGYGIWEPY